MTDELLKFPAVARRWTEGARESAESARELLADGVESLSTVTEGADAQAALARAHDAVRVALVELDELLNAPTLTLTKDVTRHLEVTQQEEGAA